jgi:hypothetical protein
MAVVDCHTLEPNLKDTKLKLEKKCEELEKHTPRGDDKHE